MSVTGEGVRGPLNDYLLYHQTIIRTQGVTHAIEGSFTLPNTHELVLVRHDRLELWSLYPATSSAECVHSMPLLGTVHGIVAVPTTSASTSATGTHLGTTATSSSSTTAGPALDAASAAASSVRRDAVHYVAMTTSLGYVTMMRYQLHEPPIGSHTASRGSATSPQNHERTTTMVVTSLRGEFVKVSELCLGRSGARMTVPGARLSVDARGEALFISALMRSKVVVPLVRTGVDAHTLWDEFATRRSAADGADGKYVDKDNEDDDEDDGGDNEQADEDSDQEREMGGLLASGSGRGGFRLATARKRRLLHVLHKPRGVIQFGSPLEVSRQTVVYSVCTLEGFADGCRFAALEEEVVEASAPASSAVGEGGAGPKTGHSEAYLKVAASTPGAAAAATKRKMLVVYAYNASVRQVQRTDLIYVPHTAHRLVSIPSEPSGPGGVLVCTDTELVWYDLSMRQVARQQQLQQQQNTQRRSTDGDSAAAIAARAAAGVFKCSVPLPRRVDFVHVPYDPSIIQHALTRLPGGFFLLLQDEFGDMFRVTLTTSAVLAAYDALRARQLEAPQRQLTAALPPELAALAGSAGTSSGSQGASVAVVNPLHVYYFDTLPACRALALFRNGYLFAGVESGPLHGLYKITRDGYGKESDYIVRHIQWSRPAPAAHAAGAASAAIKRESDEHEQLLGRTGVKRERGEDDSAETAENTTGGPRSATQVVGMPPPAPRAVSAASQEPLSHGPAPAARTIALFAPHPRCRHITCLQNYPNTPAIVSFDASIAKPPHVQEDEARDGTAEQDASPPSEVVGFPQQVEFRAVAGRGGDSVYMHAQYGCATKMESAKLLPSDGFYALFPLVSATAVQRLVRDQELLLAATTETDRALALATSQITTSAARASAHTYRQQLLALRRLAMGVVERCRGVGMDKVLLSATQATAAYTLGNRVEPDTRTAFVTDARTLAAATLEAGRGYVQITHKGLHLIPVAGETAMGDDHRATQRTEAAASCVRPTSWVHPHGKLISAASANPYTFAVAFEGGGGLAAFALDDAGVALRQLGALPSIPAITAIAVVQVPLSNLTTTAMAIFDVSGRPTRAESSPSSSPCQRDLVAVATARQQVLLFAARQLAEPLERFTCIGGGRSESAVGDEENGSGQTNDRIVSLLVTFLTNDRQAGRADASDARRASGDRSRLFCVVGHVSGALTVCELDAQTAKVLHVTTLVCGQLPCQVLVGDAETQCYVRSGPQAWRLSLVGGEPKMMPWRFAVPQRAFASYVMPHASLLSSTSSASTAASSPSIDVRDAIVRIRGPHTAPPDAERTVHKSDDDEDDGDQKDEADASGAVQRTEFLLSRRDHVGLRAEAVLALQGNQLSLFVATQSTTTSAASLEYSLDTYALPLAGRRVIAHPTRRHVCVVVNTEHRGHAMAHVAAYRNAKAEARAAGATATKLVSSIAPNAPGRTPAKVNEYASSIQLVDGEAHQLSAPYYLQDGEAALGAVVGAFADLGREPILILATADHYTHGAGCGQSASCGRGWLRAFSFKRVPVAMSGAAGGATTASTSFNAKAQGPRLALRLESLHNTLLRRDEEETDAGAEGADGVAETTSGAHRSLGGALPTAIHHCETVGLLMVGVTAGSAGLRLYAFGKRQFLRRRHLSGFPSPICAIETSFVTPANPIATTSTVGSGSPGRAPHSSSPYFASDLYQCPTDRPEMVRTACEKQLLILCATQCASVVVVSVVARQGNTTPSFLLRVARDRIPRYLTSLTMLDERTVAVSDRFGHVVFLRIPTATRFGFAEPIASLYETELEESEAYISTAQHLEEVASYHTGQVVTSLQTVPCTVPAATAAAGSTRAVQTINTLFYATALGSIGAFTPCLTEEDGATAAYAWPLIGAHARPVLLPSLLNGTVPGALPLAQQASFTPVASAVPTHHVVDGDVLDLFQHHASAVFRAHDRENVEDELETKFRVEKAQRERVLGLPARTLPSVDALIAKQRALATLPS